MKRIAGWVVAGADVGALVALRGQAADLVAHLGSVHAWLSGGRIDEVAVTIAGAALWLAAAWVALGLIAALAARLPGVTGALATRVATTVLPAVLRRVIIGSAGLGVLLAPIAAGAAAPHHQNPSAPSAPSWPTSSPSTQPPTSGDAPVPAPTWPRASSVPSTPPTPPTPPKTIAPRTSAPRTPPPKGIDPTPVPAPHPTSTTPPRPTGPTLTPAPPSTRRQVTPAPPRSPVQPGNSTVASDEVTVHAGDSLWLLAATRLRPDAGEAEIARYWPRLYAANRAVIGDDPALIQPGQVLHAPAPTPQETP